MTPKRNTALSYENPFSERRVIIAYHNMPAAFHVSHIGLGVSALNTAKVLRQNGVQTDVWAIMGAKELAAKIEASNPKPSHVVISAPWITALDLQMHLVFKYSDIHFAVVCHSNAGFLSADPTAITNFRQDLDLEQGALNFFCAGNSKRFANFIKKSYQRPCLWLPNLYFLDSPTPSPRRIWSGGTLRIGSFGAVRPLKNTTTAAAAALEIAEHFNTDTEFHISVGRIEGGSSVVKAVKAMLLNSPRVRLVEEPWYQWSQFRYITRHMHLLMQPSFSETFNMVSADGASEYVPSVVSDAIEWAPDYWKADADDTGSVARVGRQLITDAHAGLDGYQALQVHNGEGVREWKEWLG